VNHDLSATARVPRAPTPAAARSRFRPYFPIAIFTIVVALVGFWANYYGRILTGTVITPPIIQLHGAIFLGWLLLVTLQASLAARGRVAQHMRVGRWVMVYGVAVLAMGIVATLAAVGKHLDAGDMSEARMALFIPLTDMLVFGPFLAAAWIYRRRPEIHKRLIVVATCVLLIAPVHRMNWFLGMPPPVLPILFIWLAPIYAGMIYDYVTRRIVHPVYLIGIAAILFMKFGRGAIAESAPWNAFNDWVMAFYG
jgi:hypothetical protein